MSDELTPAFAISQAPNERVRAHLQKLMGIADSRPSSMTAGEKVQLEAFQRSLAEQNVTERHNQAHGGQAAMEQKERVTNAIASGNIHNQGAGNE